MTFRDPIVIKKVPTFEANFKDKNIVAIFDLGGVTIGLRFESPEQLLQLCSELIELAAKVWPEDEYMKEYLSE